MFDCAGLRFKCVMSLSPSTRTTFPFPFPSPFRFPLLLLMLLLLSPWYLVFLIPGTDGAPISCQVSRLVLRNVTYGPGGLTLMENMAPYYSCIRRDNCGDKYLEHVKPAFGVVTRVQMVGCSGKYQDAFVPISTQCMGSYYFLASIYINYGRKREPTSVPFLYVVNPNDYEISVVYHNIDKQTSKTTKVAKNSIVQIEVDKRCTDFHQVNSTDTFGVIAGAKSCLATKTYEHLMVDMIPEKSFFGSRPEKYIVPAIPNIHRNKVQIYNLSYKKLQISVLRRQKGSNLNHVLYIRPGSINYVRYNIQETTIFSPSHSPIMIVLNYKEEDIHKDPTSLTVIAPEQRWDFTTVIFGLNPWNNKGDVHKAIVIIKTEDAPGLKLNDLQTGSSLKLQLLDPNVVGYVTGSFAIKQTKAYLLQHVNKKRFQVVQYGKRFNENTPCYVFSPTKQFCSKYKPFNQQAPKSTQNLCPEQIRETDLSEATTLTTLKQSLINNMTKSYDNTKDSRSNYTIIAVTTFLILLAAFLTALFVACRRRKTAGQDQAASGATSTNKQPGPEPAENESESGETGTDSYSTIASERTTSSTKETAID